MFRMFNCASALVLLAVTSAQANYISTCSASYLGNTASGSAHVEATFSFTNGQLIVSVRNLTIDPKSVGQNLSGFSFHIQGLSTPLTLVSSSGLERFIAGNGTFTDGGMVQTGWMASAAGNSTALNALNSNAAGIRAGPIHTLVGDPNSANMYGNANASIAGNGPHNAFLAGTLTFVFTGAGLTANSILDSVMFQFGTDNEYPDLHNGAIAGILPTPAPANVILLASGGVFWIGGFLGRRRLHRRFA